MTEVPNNGAVPVAWVSPGQLANLQDIPSDGGVYLPVKKTEQGNFTMPLYARPIDSTDVGKVFDLDRLKKLWRTGVQTGRILQRADALTAEASQTREAGLAQAVMNILPIGNDRAPGDRVFPIYVRMDELRALRELAALALA